MSSLAATIENLATKNVLVVGDFMLDVYTKGQVRRISPEAPVPVLCALEERAMAGGAGNAALNLRSLGMVVKVLGRIGVDRAGQQLEEHLRSEGIDTTYLIADADCMTPRKNRMMADNHQLVRVDYERPTPLKMALADTIIAELPTLLRDVHIVAISDYAKGFLTPYFLQALIHQAQVPVIIDPKGMDFTRYRGATILKPNLSEAFAAAGLGPEATLDEAASKILKEVDIQSLVVTRAADGISIFEAARSRVDFPAEVNEVRDVTGAGDTVLAVMAAALANDSTLHEAAALANQAAAIATQKVGCARISVEDLKEWVEI